MIPVGEVLKIWIEPGCIVCNACEEACPEVFEVLEQTCVVRVLPTSQYDFFSQQIADAAEACPVEVIKYKR